MVRHWSSPSQLFFNWREAEWVRLEQINPPRQLRVPIALTSSLLVERLARAITTLNAGSMRQDYRLLLAAVAQLDLETQTARK